MENLYKHVGEVNTLLERYGVRFGIYKNGVFKEQLFPFDPIPRIITKEEFDEAVKRVSKNQLEDPELKEMGSGIGLVLFSISGLAFVGALRCELFGESEE